MQKPLLLLISKACGLWTLALMSLFRDELVLQDVVTWLKFE